MDVKRIIVGLSLLAATALAACSPSATPRLIGSYPRDGTTAPYGAPSRVYNTRLNLAVSDVDFAARQAARLAGDEGGYVAASQSWYAADGLHTLLTLSVPAGRFDAVRNSLLSLGRLLDEQLSSQPAPWPAYTAPPNSIIMVAFAASAPDYAPPVLPHTGWDPARTFTQAFGVFAGIVSVLVDVLIWISVVIGPFVLMGLGLRWLVRRARHPM